MDSPKLIWEIGTGYDLFVSLEVLHDPVRFGLRGSWAAGVRSRLPADSRDFLQQEMQGKFWGIAWLARQSGPKDGAAVLERIADISPSQRLPVITGCYQSKEAMEILEGVRTRGRWDKADKAKLRELYQAMARKEGKKSKIADGELVSELNQWAHSEEYGRALLEALEAYYEAFFAEEEMRIRPALEASVQSARPLASKLPLLELLDELSQGLRFDYADIERMKELILIPSYWTTPLTLFTPIEDHDKWMFVFGGRPANVSLVPGEVVPELLYQTLKALADPTRLRIMRYLAAEPLTPAALARRLRLRAPTVLHHLDALRLARLVNVTLSYEGRRYEARREAVKAACDMLADFLESN